ncbi:hypothetical protein HYU18_01195 [Candidatus Woesearchaeota archaeon]|nr:hypothetical protein [Candidatus Woesearchaeota archaeon]
MYLRKNVNFMLLILVLTVLIGTVAITTYFQSTYKEVTEDLETTEKQLQSVNTNFSTKLSELNKTYTELQLKSMDKEKLDQLYTDLLSAKEQLDLELTSTKDKLAKALADIEQINKELTDTKYALLLQETELLDLRAKVQNQLDTIRSRNAEIDSLKAQLCEEKKAQGKTC